MKQLYADFKNKGLEIVGVTRYYGYVGQERDLTPDAEYAKMKDFWATEHSLPWPIVFGDQSNFDNYGVGGIPHVVVIDRKGNVHEMDIGYSPEIFKKFREKIEKLLNEK
jgi:hypothetical protein